MNYFYKACVILILNISVFAGDVARKGTTGADQLLIPVGAKGIATGGAFLAILTGLESIYYNPAGLNLTPGSEAMFSYMSYIADINISYFAVSTNLDELGSLALSFKTFDFGDIPITTTEFPDGTGSTYSPAYLVGALTYSKVITDRISVGTNLKLVNETIEDVSASAFAMDVGVQYRFNQQLAIGASLKNIGTNMVYSGSGLQQRTGIPGSEIGSPNGNFEIVAEEFQIPSFFELSVAYNYQLNEQNNVLLGSTFTANNSFEDQFNFGLEYGFMETFFIRGGYNMLVGSTADQSIYGLTFGAGLDYSFTDGMGLTFDYAFREVQEFPTPNHVFTVKLAVE